LKNIIQRSISGLIFVVILISGIAFHEYTFFLLFFTIHSLTIWEFYKISNREKARPQKTYGLIASMIIFTINFLYAINYVDEKIFLFIIPLLLVVFINELYVKNRRPFLNISYTFLSFIYITLPFSLLCHMVLYKSNIEVTYKPEILLCVFFLIWTYLFGISLGKHKLFSRISPKKSWEGAIGGALVTLLSSFALVYFFPILEFENWLIISMIVVVAGTYGDLIESMLKRNANIKDSGNLIPGHGGMLDRFDSFIFAVPFVFIYLQFL